MMEVAHNHMIIMYIQTLAQYWTAVVKITCLATLGNQDCVMHSQNCPICMEHIGILLPISDTCGSGTIVQLFALNHCRHGNILASSKFTTKN